MNWLAIVAAALLAVGLGAIGHMVLRESDEAWERTPEYEGFRPVTGMRYPSMAAAVAWVRQHGRP